LEGAFVDIRSPAFAAKRLLVGCLLAVMVGCIDDPNNPQPAQGDGVEPFDHRLTFARHVNQPISDARVDRILAEAGGLLASVDSECPDVHSPATFTRLGGVSAFTDGSSVLTAESQLDAVFAVNADFKIVTFMVGVCGAPAGNDAAVVLGCAATAGSVVIVHDAPSDVWAHEWGHVQGLQHRNDCARNVMHAYELETNAVNIRERAAFLSPTPLSAFQLMREIGEPTASACTGCADEPAVEPLEQVLSRRYLQGVPRDALEGIDPDVRSAALLAHWHGAPRAYEQANAARLMGYADDPVVCAPLVEFAATVAGELDLDELSALAESLLALGRLTSVDESGVALALLTAGTSPEYWSARLLSLRTGADELQTLDAALARICVLALGIAGTPEAMAHLAELRAHEAVSRSVDPWFAAQIDEALARAEGDFARLRTTIAADRQP
jgi:hypothetical protein